MPLPYSSVLSKLPHKLKFILLKKQGRCRVGTSLWVWNYFRIFRAPVGQA